MAEGGVHHNSGKSFTGSHYAIERYQRQPKHTGFIGANNYDQLSTATLKELFYWLTTYGYEYVIDRRPPMRWEDKGEALKSYHNVLSVRNPRDGEVTRAYTRVLSDPDAYRGIEISWYWIDETRDTKQEAHDVLLSRMRESEDISGLVTSTTNGEDWVYNRFNKNADGKLYGCIYAKTEEAVNAGVIPRAYYESLRRTYSPLMAAQELDAQHVNIAGGRAYYTAGDHNKRAKAPWGDAVPNHKRPLIVYCDFNYSPAPCVWGVAQEGPDDCVHAFGEIAIPEASAQKMIHILVSRYPGFFYKIYGDASDNRGTVSNAGRTTYNQMADALSDLECMFSIDVDQGNPRVFESVENLNSGLKNALGEVRFTYDPDACPMLDADLRVVGWKPNDRGKLDNGGDEQRTHAADGLRYYWWKAHPPGRGRGVYVEPIASSAREELVGL